MPNLPVSTAVDSFMQSADQAAMRNAVGLGDVNNTSDAAKPVSAAQATAIAAVNSALTSHTGNTSNPHSTTKAQVGLGSVDNTSDAAKPVSTAAQAAIGAVASNLASLSSVVDGLTSSVETLGGRVDSLETRTGNLEVSLEALSTDTQAALDEKANLAGPTFTGTAQFDSLSVTNTASASQLNLIGSFASAALIADGDEDSNPGIIAKDTDLTGLVSFTASRFYGEAGRTTVRGGPLEEWFALDGAAIKAGEIANSSVTSVSSEDLEGEPGMWLKNTLSGEGAVFKAGKFYGIGDSLSVRGFLLSDLVDASGNVGRANSAASLASEDLASVLTYNETDSVFDSNRGIRAPAFAGDGTGITGLSVQQVSGVTPVADGSYGPIVSITVINGIITAIE